MHFLPAVHVTCEACKGKRYNDATLRVTFKGHHIANVLDLPISEALSVFATSADHAHPLDARRGRPRLRLARTNRDDPLGRRSAAREARARARSARHGKTLYILDEPTTGLHFDDTRRLLAVLDRLVDHGNTVIVVEHNLDVVRAADHVIDIGPAGVTQAE